MTTSETTVDDPTVVFTARQPDLHRRQLVEHVDDGTGHCQVCTVGDWPCDTALSVIWASHARTPGPWPSSAPSGTS